MGNDAVVVGGIVVGFFVVSAVAGVAPEVVNSLLLLMLLGALLLNSSKWIPYLSQFGDAIDKPPPTTGQTPTPVSTYGPKPI